MKDSDKLSEINDRLSLYISEFFGKPVEEVRNQLAENLTKLSEVLPEKEELINNIKKAIEEKTKIEKDQKLQEGDQKFLEIEKEVLAYLPEAESKRIITMRQWLLDNNGDYFETSYKQVIMKIHLWEVSIKNNSVAFRYAGKELQRQELQLPKESENIFDCTYTGFDGKQITRREIRQRVLDKDNKEYQCIQKAQEELKQQNKYIATQENTFSAILDGFEWTSEQKIKSMQFLTGFVGWWIISLEKDRNICRRFLVSELSKYSTYIYDSYYPDYRGSLFVAKDC